MFPDLHLPRMRISVFLNSCSDSGLARRPLLDSLDTWRRQRGWRELCGYQHSTVSRAVSPTHHSGHVRELSSTDSGLKAALGALSHAQMSKHALTFSVASPRKCEISQDLLFVHSRVPTRTYIKTKGTKSSHTQHTPKITLLQLCLGKKPSQQQNFSLQLANRSHFPFSRAHIRIISYSFGISIYRFHMVTIYKQTTSSVQTQLVYFLIFIWQNSCGLWGRVRRNCKGQKSDLKNQSVLLQTR